MKTPLESLIMFVEITSPTLDLAPMILELHQLNATIEMLEEENELLRRLLDR